MSNTYATILLPQRTKEATGKLTYSVPEQLEEKLKRGDLVSIPLRKKTVFGIILKFTEEDPGIPTKDILELKKSALLTEWQLQLLEHLSITEKAKDYVILKKMIPKRILEGTKEMKDWTPIPTSYILHPTSYILHPIPSPTLLIPQRQTEKWKFLTESIQKTIEKNKQILLLTPEIDPLPLWISELKKIAPTEAFHSKQTEKKRAKIWKEIADNDIKIIVASKLGPFTPVRNLGLIIVTNEHDDTYIEDSRPYIHTRDIALKIHEFTSAEIILESPFPNLETHEKAVNENWTIIKNHTPAQTKIIDLRDEMKKKNYSPLSEYAEEKLRETLLKNAKSPEGKKAILFLNRRGTSTAVLCRDCGHIEKCPLCKNTLILHEGQKLVCHQRHFQKEVPYTCPKCKSPHIKFLGTGTEKVEAHCRKIFPETEIIRLDKDTIKKSKDLAEKSQKFREKNSAILIGTSMIRHDLLEEVPLIIALLPDTTLTYPDPESSIKTLEQLSTLKTLLSENGELIIQTYIPENAVFTTFSTDQTEKFYEQERKSRTIINRVQNFTKTK